MCSWFANFTTSSLHPWYFLVNDFKNVASVSLQSLLKLLWFIPLSLEILYTDPNVSFISWTFSLCSSIRLLSFKAHKMQSSLLIHFTKGSASFSTNSHWAKYCRNSFLLLSSLGNIFLIRQYFCLKLSCFLRELHTFSFHFLFLSYTCILYFTFHVHFFLHLCWWTVAPVHPSLLIKCTVQTLRNWWSRGEAPVLR